MRGTLSFTVTAPTPFRALTLKLCGREHVWWGDGGGVYERHNFLKSDIVLAGAAKRGADGRPHSRGPTCTCGPLAKVLINVNASACSNSGGSESGEDCQQQCSNSNSNGNSGRVVRLPFAIDLCAFAPRLVKALTDCGGLTDSVARRLNFEYANQNFTSTAAVGPYASLTTGLPSTYVGRFDARYYAVEASYKETVVASAALPCASFASGEGDSTSNGAAAVGAAGSIAATAGECSSSPWLPAPSLGDFATRLLKTPLPPSQRGRLRHKQFVYAPPPGAVDTLSGAAAAAPLVAGHLEPLPYDQASGAHDSPALPAVAVMSK